jgi:hypothetical protein
MRAYNPLIAQTNDAEGVTDVVRNKRQVMHVQSKARQEEGASAKGLNLAEQALAVLSKAGRLEGFLQHVGFHIGQPSMTPFFVLFSQDQLLDINDKEHLLPWPCCIGY